MSSKSVYRVVVNCPDRACATSNCVFVSENDEEILKTGLVETDNFVFTVGTHSTIPENSIALNIVQRKILKVERNEQLEVRPIRLRRNIPALTMVYAQVTPIKAGSFNGELQSESLIQSLIKSFEGQVFSLQQEIAFELSGTNFKLIIDNLIVDVEGESVDVPRGSLTSTTVFVFTTSSPGSVKISGQKGFATNQIFNVKSLDFLSLGIGGLEEQFKDLFRRAFVSRVFPPSVIQRLGIKHVRGILLYGPPGTGKTLIARQIGKLLNGKEPKIVNGPEVLNKYVGQSEENIRNLFSDAEAEYAQRKDESDLHIIIFDEIDAVCKQRGSGKDGTGVHDTVVNQLLSKIDGVNALNNVLLIGMTNRRDMLDDALLRPGRLEVQIEIGLPDEPGRLQILKIHTSKMNDNAFLSRDVNLDDIAARTKNFSGAELEGLVKDASSFALNRNIDLNNLNIQKFDEDNIKVGASDFERALQDIKPAFGTSAETLTSLMPCGFEPIPQFTLLVEEIKDMATAGLRTEKLSLQSVLLHGRPGSGKSALASYVASVSEFPYVKIVSPGAFMGYSEQSKIAQITKVFEDAYRSPLSLIILDSIELLIDYVAVGPRFSVAILMLIRAALARRPPPGHKLFIIGTTNQLPELSELGLDAFDSYVETPYLPKDEVERLVAQSVLFKRRDIGAAVELFMTHAKRGGRGGAATATAGFPIKVFFNCLEKAKQGDGEGQIIDLNVLERVLARTAI
mmetsp:Transcript_29452/g.54049  ORF Transcript_29452/g.54049 Transcript_29452/m.54049 type:complete len:737 (-) Transcript_29452:552-2762(-)